jgi:hypothetical protein
MKSFRLLFLTLFCISGGILPACLPGCGCSPIQGDYFDVNSLQLENQRNGIRISASETASRHSYSLKMQFGFTYVSRAGGIRPPAAGSFIPAAMACSCKENGELGSKERLQSLTIKTRNDFDGEHSANDDITALFTISAYGQSMDLTAFIADHTGERLTQSSYFLTLKKKPELNPNLELEITITFTNGEQYQALTEAIVLTD